ncbi:hypothetical protein EAI_00354 [Harpegnathos saltator]|uniref:Uncharacterized protein n=1 Tax=Harpegnathos saltator TaxID=610380 RepID=E2BSH7_HARSA|nr:hypothetical protein EAI_00354 [Harpegnathos saltator]
MAQTVDDGNIRPFDKKTEQLEQDTLFLCFQIRCENCEIQNGKFNMEEQKFNKSFGSILTLDLNSTILET